MNNSIYLRRKNKVYLTEGANKLPANYIATILKNIDSLGYTFSGKLIERLGTLSEKEITAFYKQLVTDLKEMVGAKVKHEPMYPNFPKQVMEMSESELYFNAMMHYFGDWIGVRIMPKYEKEERMPLLDKVDLKVIDLGSEEEFKGLCRNLIGASTSISASDKEDVAWYVEAYKDTIEELLPNEIPHKENLSYTTGLLLKHTNAGTAVLDKYFKTATDVLRLATAQSEGDVSLAENTKFRNFKRKERRLLLGLLENCKSITEDMLRHKKRWIRLGERLHPGEYKKRYPKCAEAFDILRNDKAFSTFNGRVEAALEKEQWDVAIDLLKTRPGDFARRLDHLLRNVKTEWTTVTDVFEGVADKVATPVLLQVLKHFKHRNEPKELRTVFPKGNTAKVQALTNELPHIVKKARLAIVDICENTLIARFKDLPELGKVYLDEDLKNYIVPFSQRSASKALRTVVRGSRIAMPELGDTIRFFLWWKEGKVGDKETGRVDIDLSAVMYDEEWNYKEHISYTNLKSAKYGAAHSGDITSAPDGACEFIDLDIPSILKYGGRYVVMSLNSFTGQYYCNMPECFGGWMMRQEPQSGEIFEPKTVLDKIDVTANTKICIPVILDLQEREVLWADLALTSNPNYRNNVEGNKKGMVLMGKAMTTLVKMNLHELFTLHIAARGSLVETIEEADTVFAKDKGITPFDIETIMGEFM